MSSEIAIPEAEPTSLEVWARSAHQAGLVAVSLAKTSFVPDSMRGRPEEVTACILVGQELGLSPMSALRSVNLIKGTPALTAMTMRALVVVAGHEVWVESSTTTRAVVKGRRKDSTHIQESTWTMDRAKQLGVAGKDNWRHQPTAMLVARATAEVCRLVAPDALLGLAYASEELDDDTTPAEQPEQPDKPKRRTAKRAPLPEQRRPPELETAPEPDPEPDPAGPVDPQPEPDPEPPPAVPDDEQPTKAQTNMLHALYNKTGVASRDERLDHARIVLDKNVDTFTDLTKADVSKLIDSLTQAADQLPPDPEPAP